MFSWAAASALFAEYLRALTHQEAAEIDYPSVWFVPLAILAMQLPFFGCRAVLGWRLAPAELAGRERLRFTIRDLLAVTTAVAVILAVSRGAVPSSAGGMGGAGMAGGGLSIANLPMNVGAGQGLRWDFQRGQTAACVSFALIGLGVVWPVFFALFPIRRKTMASLMLLAELLCATALIAAASWAVRPGLSFASLRGTLPLLW